LQIASCRDADPAEDAGAGGGSVLQRGAGIPRPALLQFRIDRFGPVGIQAARQCRETGRGVYHRRPGCADDHRMEYQSQYSDGNWQSAAERTIFHIVPPFRGSGHPRSLIAVSNAAKPKPSRTPVRPDEPKLKKSAPRSRIYPSAWKCLVTSSWKRKMRSEHPR
jgi:hypothetical protein